jgi:hypothetical protein
MKKINESELKNRVNKLREYIAVLEAGQLNIPGSISDITKNVATGQQQQQLIPTMPPVNFSSGDFKQLPYQFAKPPQATGTAPKATGTAPQATGTAPKATGTAPQATGTAPQATGTAPGAVKVDPRDGAVGQDLARMGISKQNRLDQAFVDKALGAGKYKAGSAESNLALQALAKKNGGKLPDTTATAPAQDANAAKPAPNTGAMANAPAANHGNPYDDEGNMMPGWSKDENNNPVWVGDQGGKTFVEPATQALANQGRQDAKEKQYAANQDAEDAAQGAAMQAQAQAQAAPPGEASYTPPANSWKDSSGNPIRSASGTPVTGGTPGDSGLYGNATAGESYLPSGQKVYSEDQALARIIQLARGN